MCGMIWNKSHNGATFYLQQRTSSLFYTQLWNSVNLARLVIFFLKVDVLKCCNCFESINCTVFQSCFNWIVFILVLGNQTCTTLQHKFCWFNSISSGRIMQRSLKRGVTIESKFWFTLKIWKSKFWPFSINLDIN